MATPRIAAPSSSLFTTRVFWEGLWRTSGPTLAILVIAMYFVYGAPPQLGASPEDLEAFYTGNRARILVGTVLGGMTLLYLLWFAATLRNVLSDAGMDGWGAAATASSAVLGASLLLVVALVATLAYSAPAAGHGAVASSMSDFAWTGIVLTSFPRAMLVMAGTFGLWRARLISNTGFAAGVAALLLVLAGGTTWVGGGIWAPDGLYSRFVSPLICLAWVAAVSRVILRSPATRSGW